jgi:hypothetical protein
MDTFGRSQSSFLETSTNIGNNDRDRIVCSRVNGVKKGEEEFCEALKVDVSKTKEKYFQASITNTVVLVSVLFEDFGVAVEILEKAKKDKKSKEAFPIGHSILFNQSFEFEQGFLKKEFNAMCVFGYRELYKNFLLILVEMHCQINRVKTPVPKRIMDLFGMSTGQIVAHMMRRGKFKQSKFSQAYRMDYNSNHFIVGNSVTRPVQFSLGALPSGAAFTDKRGIGWTPTNVAEYFQVSSSDEDNGEKRSEQKMISSKLFEAYHIMLWTMRCIKVIKVKNSDKMQFHGPEGRSLYCLNLNCRAPPGRFFWLDLSFR